MPATVAMEPLGSEVPDGHAVGGSDDPAWVAADAPLAAGLAPWGVG